MTIAYVGNTYHKIFLEDYLRKNVSSILPTIDYVSLVGPRFLVLKRLFYSAWRTRKSRLRVFIPLSSAPIYQLAFLVTGFSAILYSDGIADLLDSPPLLYRLCARIKTAVSLVPIQSMNQYLSLLARVPLDFISDISISGPDKSFVLINLKAPGPLPKRERIGILIDCLSFAKAYALKHGYLLLISPHKSAFDCISEPEISDLCHPSTHIISHTPIYAHLASTLCRAFITLASGAAADAMAIGGDYPVFLLNPGIGLSNPRYYRRNAAYLDALMTLRDKRLSIISFS